MVAVVEIERPGHVDTGVGPGSPTVSGPHKEGVVASGDRDDTGDSAIAELVGSYVAEPSGQDGSDVAVQGSGAAKDGDVASPAGFFAGGTVGGDLDKVGDLGTIDVLNEAVHRVVGALKPAGSSCFAAEHQCGEVLCNRS